MPIQHKAHPSTRDSERFRDALDDAGVLALPLVLLNLEGGVRQVNSVQEVDVVYKLYCGGFASVSLSTIRRRFSEAFALSGLLRSKRL